MTEVAGLSEKSPKGVKTHAEKSEFQQCMYLGTWETLLKLWSPPSVDNLVNNVCFSNKSCTNDVSIYQSAYFLGICTALEDPQLIVVHILLLGAFTHS